jgi:hypothetical protein
MASSKASSAKTARVKLIAEDELTQMGLNDLMAITRPFDKLPVKVTNNAHRNANNAWQEICGRVQHFPEIEKRYNEGTQHIASLSGVVDERDQLLGQVKGLRLDMEGAAQEIERLQATASEQKATIEQLSVANGLSAHSLAAMPGLMRSFGDICTMVTSHADVHVRALYAATQKTPLELVCTVGSFAIVITEASVTVHAPGLKPAPIKGRSFETKSSLEGGGLKLDTYLTVQALLARDPSISIDIQHDRMPSHLLAELARGSQLKVVSASFPSHGATEYAMVSTFGQGAPTTDGPKPLNDKTHH